MIDLHTHTTESDGTYSPHQLVEAAVGIGLEALAITDHDNFNGYDAAAPAARSAGLDLVCGIELSSRLARTGAKRGRSVHILGYFLGGPPTAEFREWLGEIQSARRDRNRRLVDSLNRFDVDVTIEEVEAVGGYMTGRPHFASVLLRKGYVRNFQEAFDRYLDETAEAYVERLEPSVVEGIQRIASGGGLAVLAHPVRLNIRDLSEEEKLLGGLRDEGLHGIEAYHTDHGPEAQSRYLALADRHGLLVTGGSDFHGDLKPRIKLGTGTGDLAVPREVLDRMRASVHA